MMKYWDLFSIMRTERSALDKLLQDKRWVSQSYVDESWTVAEDLAYAAMALFPMRFKTEDGYLFCCPPAHSPPDSLSALEAYKKFGGKIIEETLERGNARVD